MADKFRYSFDLTKKLEEQLKQDMLASGQQAVTSSPGMMSADPPVKELQEAEQSKYDPYSFIQEYKDMLFSMFGGEEEYSKVVAEQDAQLPKEQDPLKKVTEPYFKIIDVPQQPPVQVEQLEPDTESTQQAISKATEQTLGIMQIEEYLDGIEQEKAQQGLMSPLAPSESLRPKARPEEDLLSIPSNINMSFLDAKEGFELDAYIPKDKKGNPIDNSGVTIGTGVDLGGKNEKYFEGLDPSILSKLKPHLGKKRKDAQKSLEESPFSLTKDEAITLDTFVKAKEFDVLRKRWNKDSKIDWDDLPSNQATVVASVYYQHGNQTFGYNFWKQTTSGDWDAAHNNLMTWGGSTPSRRRDEAKLLKMDT